MSEIKHTFQAGKMNKDFDERLVPNGEYRDALNIEVRTSDGSDVGSAQTLHGNIERYETYPYGKNASSTINWLGEQSEVVGSIANERTNKVYFFIASPPVNLFGDATQITKSKTFKDMIVEYDTTTRTISPIVTDVFEYHDNDVGSPDTISGDFSQVTLSSTKYIKPGMRVQAFNTAGQQVLWDGVNYDKVVVRDVIGNIVHFDRVCVDVGDTNPAYWIFTADPVLGFHRNSAQESKLITGINIIDDFLFWTDNNSEPKKINIKRSKAGTPSFGQPSKLYIEQPGSANNTLVPISDVDIGTDAYLKEEHITVIKRAPRTSPKLEMSRTSREGENVMGFSLNVFIADDGNLRVAGDIVPNVEITGATFYEGDVIIFEHNSTTTPLEVRANVVSVSGNIYEIEILTIDTAITSANVMFSVELEQDKSLFELKFGRFAYRYKYQDGEYSSFSPWSELAFLPSVFDFVPKKGYNLGMVNGVKSLKITDFVVEDDLRPDDVTEVDILYKDTVSPNVYVVKTIKRGLDPEWLESSSSGSSGVLQITSEMIHRTLPSSQILRAWDNVPRLAKAQEVTGNRVVYANYLQNYDVKQPITITQKLEKEEYSSGVTFGTGITSSELYGRKSLKSIRKYKVGVVFGDKHGRETPVLGMGGLSGIDTLGEATLINADVHNPKVNAPKITKLSAKQNWENEVNSYNPSNWMDYYKYYVKETTNEYYNLVMDRWYDSEDGNIWISFQSADRNKVDIETYLILKNEHGNDNIVEEEARYKILAVENEAPNYVKTTEKILGSSAIDSDLNTLASLSTAMVVTLNGGPWESSFKDIKFDGIGYARIRGIKDGVIKYSEWVKVSRMNDAIHQVTTIEPFGDSASMYEIFGVEEADYGTVTIELELKEDVVENKPEFDGRFFVKIYKDSTLISSVLQQTASDLVYNTVGSYKYNYIATTATNPANSSAATTGDYTGDGWVGFGHWTGSTVSAPSGFGTGCDTSDKTDTKAFWNSWNTSANKTHWFLDEAKAAENHSLGEREGLGGFNSQVNDGTKSSLDFSNRGQSLPSSGAAADFRNKMITTGTLFRFRGDPDEVVYQVRGKHGSGNNDAVNYMKGGCVYYTGDNNSGHRKTFRTFFSRADNPYTGLDTSVWDPRGELDHSGKSKASIDFVKAYYATSDSEEYSEGNAIWETEPKEDVGMDLYYEATSALPMYLTEKTNEAFAPINSTVTCYRPGTGNISIPEAYLATIVRDIAGVKDTSGLVTTIQVGDLLRFTHSDGTVTESKVLSFWGVMDTEDDNYVSSGSVTGYYQLDNELYKYKTILPWFNCYTFGNGLESDRIRDDFNAPTIDNGVKVSTMLDTYGEERRANGLIFSGIYNSNSGVNRLNEFNMAEAITKDLNPSYGSIQALKSRDTNLVTFCEDKVLQILANKDALYNADGSANVTASNAVLGDAKTFAGDFGISSNPESLARDGYRIYFTDKQRNKVLRLSQDGLTPISDIGMISYFRDNLQVTHQLLGSFDEIKGEYNLSLKHTPPYPRYDKVEGITWTTGPYTDKTISFSEKTKGWTSFKSFIPQTGLSINDEYLTATEGRIWSHHIEPNIIHDPTSTNALPYANNFYSVQYDSSIDVLFNDNPGSVKGFTTINYEGSQAKIDQFTTQAVTDAAGNSLTANDSNYYNLNAKTGWYVNSFATDQQDGKVKEFMEKEGKWFNNILGITTTLSNLDTSEFSVQGIGQASATSADYTPSFILTIQEDGE